MKVIDALGVACPGPVVAAKKELEEGKKEGFQILVDNQIAVDNLRKFAASQNCEFAYTKLEEKKYEVHIVPTSTTKLSPAKTEEQPQEAKSAGQGTVVVLCSNKMGEGDEALGKILIKGYIYALTQLEELPKTILMYNSGIFLACEGSESLEDLKTLEENGVEILACGTCLNHYQMQPKLAVGSVTNMYEIAQKMAEATKVIRP